MSAAGFASERLSLRALESSDAEALQDYLNEPELIGRRYLPWRIPDVAPLSREQVEGILETWAKENDCGVVALSSGVQRTDAHRFYEEKAGYEKPSYVFKKVLG